MFFDAGHELLFDVQAFDNRFDDPVRFAQSR